MGNTIILVTVQLSFIYNRTMAILLILKFQYQWYFHKLISGEIACTVIATPYGAIIASILFYLSYQSSRQNYSFDLFKSRKEIKEVENKNSIILKMINDGLMVLSENKELLFSNDIMMEFFHAD